MSDGDLTSFGASLEAMFRKMGMSDPMALSRLASGWDDLAGTPWSGRSKPLFIQGKTLVVEAESPSMVAFLQVWERRSGDCSGSGPGRRCDRQDRGAGTPEPVTPDPLIDSF